MQRWRTVLLSGLTLVALFCAGLAVHSAVNRWSHDDDPMTASVTVPVSPVEEDNVLWGSVHLDGDVKLEVPERGADAYCAQGPNTNETVLTSEEGALRNVVVSATYEGDEAFELPESPESHDLNFELSNCDYYPRVTAASPKDRLHFSNKDQTFHVLVLLDGDGETFHRWVLKPGEEHVVDLDGYVGLLELTCGAHPWEHGFVQVVDDTLVSVTGQDGRYSIHPLHPGTYEVTAWHERFGEQSATLVWEAGSLEQSFTFEADPEP